MSTNVPLNLRQNAFISPSFSCDLGESFNSESTQHKSAKFVLGPSCLVIEHRCNVTSVS